MQVLGWFSLAPSGTICKLQPLETAYKDYRARLMKFGLHIVAECSLRCVKAKIMHQNAVVRYSIAAAAARRSGNVMPLPF